MDGISAVACAGFACGIGYVEYQTALLCCMLRESQRATQALLDNCSDGFCTVDGVTGHIINASSKLHSMLNTEQLDQFSRNEKVQRAVKRALLDGELVPIVAVLRLPTSTGCSSTDLRMNLIPYAAGQGHVGICVQMQMTPAMDSALSMETCSPLLGGKRLAPAEPLAPAELQPEADSASLGCKKNQATETSISWERDGFVCKSCSSARPSRRAAPRSRPASSVRSGGSRRKSRMRQAPSSNQSMDQETSGDASSTSWQNRPAICAEPLLSHFAPTSAWSAAVSLLRVLVAWNLPRLPGYCCPFHMAVNTAKLLLGCLYRHRCNPLWSPLTGWQCSHCTCMNRDVKEVCEQCGFQNEAVAGPTAVDEHAPVMPMAEGPAGSFVQGPASDIEVASAAGETDLSSRPALEGYLQHAMGSACSSALDSAGLHGSLWFSEGRLPRGAPGKAGRVSL